MKFITVLSSMLLASLVIAIPLRMARAFGQDTEEIADHILALVTKTPTDVEHTNLFNHRPRPDFETQFLSLPMTPDLKWNLVQLFGASSRNGYLDQSVVEGISALDPAIQRNLARQLISNGLTKDQILVWNHAGGLNGNPVVAFDRFSAPDQHLIAGDLLASSFTPSQSQDIFQFLKEEYRNTYVPAPGYCFASCSSSSFRPTVFSHTEAAEFDALPQTLREKLVKIRLLAEDTGDNLSDAVAYAVDKAQARALG